MERAGHRHPAVRSGVGAYCLRPTHAQVSFIHWRRDDVRA
ncbi:MAG: hypothetical protein AVDCRST_MAG18-3546 [uncultured Thermomicrobiales bacterium]|uniref:Uncharacterized protein n=1 Tax=uncultured Thermomicrobiales bacterium TaxID=1645740 RepID=A0A6J4VNX9_9BACT|nr:MAG: hypothetical protein AVDCRST_MAG18-3546 [uncultured Thermomicrobiales bacterium]